jgi:uncharacterized CHY-type Zn-finger protein
MKEPESMDEVVYFTNRSIGNGNARVWVFKQLCPKCGKGLMGKPIDEKGKKAIRAKEYVCPECKHSVEKQEYEETLTADAKYTCPQCAFSGETSVPFKRKNIQGVKTLRLTCSKCKAPIDVTKKMKSPKDKKKGAIDLDDD